MAEHTLRILHLSDLHECIAIDGMREERKAKLRVTAPGRCRVLGYRVEREDLGFPFPGHVIGLDSAWLCGDDNDAQRLLLTSGQGGTSGTGSVKADTKQAVSKSGTGTHFASYVVRRRGYRCEIRASP